MQRLTTISPILWVILESGRLRANLKATEARYRQTVAVSGNYLRLAQAQYKFGLVDYLIVIDAERTLLTNQLSLAQAVNLQMAASIHLIKALGGGWNP